MARITKGYKLDLASQTLTITAAFADAANNLKSAEYELIQKIKADFPQIKIVYRTHATPIKYKNSDGTKTKYNQFKKLTYKNMEQFMESLPYGEVYMDIYKKVKITAKINNSPYSIVRKWFVAQFSQYKSNPLFYIDNAPEIIDFSGYCASQTQNEKKGA